MGENKELNIFDLQKMHDSITKLRELRVKFCIEHVEFLKTEGLLKEDAKNEIGYHLDYGLNEIRIVIPAHLTTNGSEKDVTITTEWVNLAEINRRLKK